MPDTKRSGLAVIVGSALAADDIIDLTDISDTTMAVSGTDKKTTLADLIFFDEAQIHPQDIFDSAAPIPVAAAGTIAVFAKTVAGRGMPAFVGPSGMDSVVQPFLARNKVGYWNPQGGAVTVPGVFGYANPTITGFTATARTIATTNMFNRMRRIGYVTATTAGTVGNFRAPLRMFTLGAGGTPALGGFHKILRFGISDAAAVAGARMFMGVAASAVAPTNVEPSTLTNVIGMGHGAADTTMKIYYGGSVAQTPIDLGVDFPANTRNVDAYDLSLYAPQGTPDTVRYQVIRLNTEHTVSGTLTAGTAGLQLPDANNLLANQWGYRTNNATALAVGLDVMSDYIETDQ